LDRKAFFSDEPSSAIPTVSYGPISFPKDSETPPDRCVMANPLDFFRDAHWRQNDRDRAVERLLAGTALPAIGGVTRGVRMLQLQPDEYHRVIPLLRDVPINTIFARTVVEGRAGGRVYVDDPLHPRACYVAHPYGMSLLFGSTTSASFRASLTRYLKGEAPSRSTIEWLQLYPSVWRHILDPMSVRQWLGKKPMAASDEDSITGAGLALLDTRVNFRFDRNRYEGLRRSLALPPDCEIDDDLEAIYSHMKGSVVPSTFWKSATELGEHGAAYGLRYRGELASVAFSAFALGDALELGIETCHRFRGRGLATHACRAMIDYCIERHLEPVWACRLSNVASYRLAERLGFAHARSLPYYRLPLSAGIASR
jgi:RimJ/RimL family protein N-acetyltransferase